MQRNSVYLPPRKRPVQPLAGRGKIKHVRLKRLDGSSMGNKQKVYAMVVRPEKRKPSEKL